ncbi:peptide chain release factor N(5)-glutamine methyltransferase [Mycoplasma procyoni]|uniref:peptide chain release factor N(5)-glutamine methyltransferase n=1 Tax=Mycoplasma procyoni TaxID=568784 RepID=UPI00197B2DE1|nr:peptide chain release factor N(5)-glutamine methyltransferase [Mycoplasma procyoni]MBN3534505.1 peptide chain release factor N(5)-glutamine methyltransferase [Mycoplasma procyoni]
MQDYNKRKNELLHEKVRYSLPLEISKQEEELLKTDTPIQKIISFVEMQNVKINVNHKVLIPRYETEEVILEAYKYINKESKVLDLCCGSGFIGIVISKNTGCSVVFGDIDDQAIEQTKENALQNKIENYQVFKSDLFTQIPKQKFDLIISNPPYIPENITLDSSVLNHEPHHALFAKNNGNYFYQKIVEQACEYLNKNGALIFEISHWNLDFFNSLKDNKNLSIEIKNDINQKERIAIIRFNN